MSAAAPATKGAAALEWKLPAELGRAEIDRVGCQLLEEQPSALEIDVIGFGRCAPTTEPDLLDLLTYARRIGCNVSLLVNPAPGAKDLAKRYERTFTRSGIGFVLSELADHIYDKRGTDHKRAVDSFVEAELAEAKGLLWSGQQRIAPIRPDERLSAARLVTETSPKRMQELVFGEVRRLLPQFRAGRALRDISNCAQQAIHNVGLHASKQLPPPQDDALGFFALRRVLPEDLASLAETSVPPLSDYYAREARCGKRRRQLELTVADNGSGIAATMARTPAVYEADSDLGAELAELTRALDKGTSERPGNVRRGLGFPEMLDSIDRLGGMMMIRSGRVRVHAWRAPHTPAAQLSKPEPLPYPVGTTLVFVFPEP